MNESMEVVVKALVIVVVLVVPACTDEPYPSCIDIGCPDAPSGTPDIWSPCTEQLCYCRAENTDVEACTVEVQS